MLIREKEPYIMLKGIPPIISPELMKIMMEMGHGDELVLADGNFPTVSCGQRVVRCEGHSITQILPALLQFLPLDTYAANVGLMEIVPGDSVGKPIVWDYYKAILENGADEKIQIEYIERFAFYERAKNAYAIVATSETALYGNIILKKGVVK